MTVKKIPGYLADPMEIGEESVERYKMSYCWPDARNGIYFTANINVIKHPLINVDSVEEVFKTTLGMLQERVSEEFPFHIFKSEFVRWEKLPKEKDLFIDFPPEKKRSFWQKFFNRIEYYYVTIIVVLDLVMIGLITAILISL